MVRLDGLKSFVDHLRNELVPLQKPRVCQRRHAAGSLDDVGGIAQGHFFITHISGRSLAEVPIERLREARNYTTVDEHLGDVRTPHRSV